MKSIEVLLCSCETTLHVVHPESEFTSPPELSQRDTMRRYVSGVIPQGADPDAQRIAVGYAAAVMLHAATGLNLDDQQHRVGAVGEVVECIEHHLSGLHVGRSWTGTGFDLSLHLLRVGEQVGDEVLAAGFDVEFTLTSAALLLAAGAHDRRIASAVACLEAVGLGCVS